KPATGAPSTFAIFEALREKYGGGWDRWPREYRDPQSRAVKRFARANAGRVAFHEWLQRAARAQLDAVQRRSHELGMPIGLYVDLALGADRGGAGPDHGGYVHYPVDDLLAVLAEESRARRALVIGEDLGTVSAELRAKLQQTGLLSYRPLFFEKTPEGELAPPQAYPRDALTCVSTHDLPTWQGYWA